MAQYADSKKKNVECLGTQICTVQSWPSITERNAPILFTTASCEAMLDCEKRFLQCVLDFSGTLSWSLFGDST